MSVGGKFAFALTCTAAGAAILSLAVAAEPARAAPEIGKPAPDFTGTDINGKTVKLSDYKGKIVVLESYNQDCPYCIRRFRAANAAPGDGERR